MAGEKQGSVERLTPYELQELLRASWAIEDAPPVEVQEAIRRKLRAAVDRGPEPDQKERWTLEGRMAGQTVAFGVAPAPGERVEVVRASRFEEVQQERDQHKRNVEALLFEGDKRVERAEAERDEWDRKHAEQFARAERALADLERAQEALAQLRGFNFPGTHWEQIVAMRRCAGEALVDARERGGQ